MKAMTAHIVQGRAGDTVENVLRDELSRAGNEVLSRGDWKNSEIFLCDKAIDEEIAAQVRPSGMSFDSVKGEDDMRLVYVYAKKASDMITLLPNQSLAFTECKYAIKIGGTGPFGSADAFKRDVSKKFRDMEKKLAQDHEVISSLRVLVVNDRQLPFSISHVQALQAAKLPAGSFSPDNRVHQYVLCSTNTVRTMLMNPPQSQGVSPDFYFFAI